MEHEQSKRLVEQHNLSGGVEGIFTEIAQQHDLDVKTISKKVYEALKKTYDFLEFRHKTNIKKTEINDKLQALDKELGTELFVKSASIIPDGGVIEVKDDNGNWRTLLVTEAKFQGRDIENIRQKRKVGKDNDQDLMAAGNAIERSYKNIAEVGNYLLTESHFPYVLFLAGSNFLTEDIEIEQIDGSYYTLKHGSGKINRLDRLTASTHGMKINNNRCKNKFVSHNGKSIMLQSVSIYTTGNGEKWEPLEMTNIMLDVAKTSIQVIFSDLYRQVMDNKKNGAIK